MLHCLEWKIGISLIISITESYFEWSFFCKGPRSITPQKGGEGVKRGVGWGRRVYLCSSWKKRPKPALKTKSYYLASKFKKIYFFCPHNWAFYSNLESIYLKHLFSNICNYSMYCQNNIAQKSLDVLETSKVVGFLREAVFEAKLAFM